MYSSLPGVKPRLHDEVPVAGSHTSPGCQLVPFQYWSSLWRWIRSSTVASPAPPVSDAVPQTSGVPDPQPAL